MPNEDVGAQFALAGFNEKMLVMLLALCGDLLNKSSLLQHVQKAGLKDAGGKSYNFATLAELVSCAQRHHFVVEMPGNLYACATEVMMPALHAAIADHLLGVMCAAIETANPVRQRWAGEYEVYSHRQALGRLRMTMLRGDGSASVLPWLDACFQFFDAKIVHPFVAIFGRPFDVILFEQVHPEIQPHVLGILVANAQYLHASVPLLTDYIQHYLVRHAGTAAAASLTLPMAEHYLLCGRLAEVQDVLQDNERPVAQLLRSGVLLLGGALEPAGENFDAAMKAVRKDSGKRKILIDGIAGYLYALALVRSADPKRRKAGDAYLEAMAREEGMPGSPVFQALVILRQVQNGVLKAEEILRFPWGGSIVQKLFFGLIYYWLALPQLQEKRSILLEVLREADLAGFPLIAAQAASLLGRLEANVKSAKSAKSGATAYAERAATLRQQYGFTDMAEWFERQEPWQRQLSALINLQVVAGAAHEQAQSRLVWLLSYEPHYGLSQIEPREQKRDARGNWSKGRPVALKRLREEPEQFDFLTPQDLQVASHIAASLTHYRYGGTTYDLDQDKAIVALIGHPLVFWQDAPTTRVELLGGAPQLLIQDSGGMLQLSLAPPIHGSGESVQISKETPTRLRIINITDEHRRIGDIIGTGLRIPQQAKQHVLQAISAISSLITVQSDIGGGAANVEQVTADERLHVHLLPHGHGLKMQILVRPLPDGGPYYAPGSGSENVIAEVAGKPLQAHRALEREHQAEQTLIAACPVLCRFQPAHGEWLLDDAEDCLELLLELQSQPPEQILLAWPEGERFKVGARLGSQQFRLSIKGDKDWFAAGGELQVAEDKVLDLRQLLELLKGSKSRFIALGGNEFMALTEEFHRRLSEIAAFADLHGKGVRVHPLAAFALEELAEDVAALKADKVWKAHLARLKQLDTMTPQLPGTLQAELRDYQLSGFEWLARLAHWGVGACLADDMGLGKTLQALALLLLRAPQGPALVIAPTSVCMNWISEVVRFAPTLNVILFGAGDRQETLADLQPFDLVIASYGLLQQEIELFAAARWHTVVLDEAQAIKNAATKRSQAVMALSADFRMIATGTPLENHLGELWNLFRFINPGLLGSMEQFNLRFANPIERLQDAEARNRLRRLIQPFILRRTKAQVLSELPSRTEIVLQVDLSPEEAALYETLRRTALERLAAADAPAGQKSLQILAEIMKLRRACCNPQLVAPELGLASSKLAAFAELLTELLENKHKVLVFSQFVDHLSLIRAHLEQQGVRYQYLDGATPMQERKVRVDAFQAGDADVFLISLKAGGMGINLTAADYVIHMDPWWNPAVEDQASDRAHRMGQLRPVTIYRLVARHTIEETIVNLHQHKRDLADSLLEGSDLAARMSASEMLTMLQEGMR
jgi:superfamily II DNA or RNA helicase